MTFHSSSVLPASGSSSTLLDPALLERTLAKLGVPERPEPDAAGLARLHEAFASRVPFDNVRKRIHLANGEAGPLPGDDPTSFLEDWLRDGTGGTCWAIAGALHALLASLGFRAARALSTMLVGSSDLPPNHGTVVVELDGERWLADPVLKPAAPLRLDPRGPTAVDHPARGARAVPGEGTWTVTWWPLHVPDSLDCRLGRIGASAQEFRSLHEATRGWSPFNFELYVRVVRGDATGGLCFGRRARLDGTGARTSEPVGEAERRRYLVDEVGMSEEIAIRVPPDVPTPPPPGSRAAARTARPRDADER